MLAILSTHPIQYQVPLWQALARDGRTPFEVWYLSDQGTRPSFDPEFKQTFAWDLEMLSGYPHDFLPVNANHDVARFRKLRLAAPLTDRLRERKVKAVWVQGWQVAAYWQAISQAHAAGLPVWLRGESNDLAPVPPWKRTIKQLALRRLFARVSDFLYIGAANRRFYKNFGVKDEQLHPAYYCVDNDRFSKQAEGLRSERKRIREGWGIKEDSFCVLFAGKFIPKKRPLDVVAAASHLKQHDAERRMHLLFAGSGDLGGKLRESCNVVFDAENKGTSADGNGKPEASFTGFLNQTEISKAYVAADCLVLPSDHRETWGLVVNEAMASGLPCVVSDACGCAEDLVAPISSSLCFPLGNVEALSESLQSLISQGPALKLPIASQLAKFDFAFSVKTVNEIYCENAVTQVTTNLDRLCGRAG